MKPPNCAVCGKKPVDAAYRPFCSKRCADIDLGRWLSDRYAIPAVENESADDEDWPLNDPHQD
jgi:endogenous inhibitor of DNA gyrase (YacG/DUF329 family)